MFEDELEIMRLIKEFNKTSTLVERTNIKKDLEDKAKTIKDEYEKFNDMYIADGILTKCPCSL